MARYRRCNIGLVWCRMTKILIAWWKINTLRREWDLWFWSKECLKLNASCRMKNRKVTRRNCHYTENCNSYEVGRDDHSECGRITGLRDDGMRDWKPSLSSIARLLMETKTSILHRLLVCIPKTYRSSLALVLVYS